MRARLYKVPAALVWAGHQLGWLVWLLVWEVGTLHPLGNLKRVHLALLLLLKEGLVLSLTLFLVILSALLSKSVLAELQEAVPSLWLLLGRVKVGVELFGLLEAHLGLGGLSEKRVLNRGLEELSSVVERRADFLSWSVKLLYILDPSLQVPHLYWSVAWLESCRLLHRKLQLPRS